MMKKHEELLSENRVMEWKNEGVENIKDFKI